MTNKNFEKHITYYVASDADGLIYGIGKNVDETLADARKNGWNAAEHDEAYGDILFCEEMSRAMYFHLLEEGGNDLSDFACEYKDGTYFYSLTSEKLNEID